MKRSSHYCARHTLANGSVATVEGCDCEIVHLTLGAVTLRFDGNSLRSLRDTLNQAVDALPNQAVPLVLFAQNASAGGDA